MKNTTPRHDHPRGLQVSKYKPSVWGLSYPSLTGGQYYCCWWPGSLCRQAISTHDIDYVKQVGPSLPWRRISATCVMSLWRNDMNCKYMFMFPIKNLAHKVNKRLTIDPCLHNSHHNCCITQQKNGSRSHLYYAMVASSMNFHFPGYHQQCIIWARFPSLAWSKLRLCLANHRAGYFSNLACDWLSIAWAYSEQETENGPWFQSCVYVIMQYFVILDLYIVGK